MVDVAVLLLIAGIGLILSALVMPVGVGLRSGDAAPAPAGRYERFRQWAARHEPVVRVAQLVVGAVAVVVGVLRLILG